MPRARKACSDRSTWEASARRPSVTTGSCSSRSTVSGTAPRVRALASCCCNTSTTAYGRSPSHTPCSPLRAMSLRDLGAEVALLVEPAVDAIGELARDVGVELAARAPEDLVHGDL